MSLSRIARATAQAYVVKSGEYIQVIDVAGRQCTDFQCFSARKLDKDIENALDATVTRTLTGRSYPAPGLPSKAFGRDFEPLDGKRKQGRGLANIRARASLIEAEVNWKKRAGGGTEFILRTPNRTRSSHRDTETQS